MSRKGFLVKVELEIQKVTCPGVYLCSNGKVSLQIHLLDSSVQTISHKPVFPILCYEKFVFSKTFHNNHRLNELQRSLNNEWFYSELIQWNSCDEGCVLASFQTTLDDLLYPPSFRGSVAGIDIDLLMETTKLFPGTIAPKLEVSTKTTIEEILCDIIPENPGTVLVNPKGLVNIQPRIKSRPRQVCHSIAFSRAQKHIPIKPLKTRPIFKYRRVPDDLILRNNPNIVLRDDLCLRTGNEKCPSIISCYCRTNSKTNDTLPKPLSCKTWDIHNTPDMVCNSELHKDNCSICSTYEGYFSSKTKSTDRSNCITPKLCTLCQHHYKKYHLRSRDGSACPSDSSENLRHKICHCIPDDKPSSLARQLHEKLSKTLDTNSKFFQKCIACEEVVV